MQVAIFVRLHGSLRGLCPRKGVGPRAPNLRDVGPCPEPRSETINRRKPLRREVHLLARIGANVVEHRDFLVEIVIVIEREVRLDGATRSRI